MPSTRISAGLLMYRRSPARAGLQVLLVHPGGPYWTNKDDGAWTIPKGEVQPDEDLLATAQREFAEETGTAPPADPARYSSLGSVKQKGGKLVHAWAFEGDLDTSAVRSNTFNMEWPPRSGKWVAFPEIDQAAFFDLATARKKINPAQAAWLDALESSPPSA